VCKKEKKLVRGVGKIWVPKVAWKKRLPRGNRHIRKSDVGGRGRDRIGCLVPGGGATLTKNRGAGRERVRRNQKTKLGPPR